MFLASCYKIKFLFLTVMHCISLILYDLPKIKVTISDEDYIRKAKDKYNTQIGHFAYTFKILNCNWLSLLEFDIMLAIW